MYYWGQQLERYASKAFIGKSFTCRSVIESHALPGNFATKYFRLEY